MSRRKPRAARCRPRKLDPVLEIALNYFAQLLDLSDVPIERRARLLILERQILEALR